MNFENIRCCETHAVWKIPEAPLIKAGVDPLSYCEGHLTQYTEENK